MTEQQLEQLAQAILRRMYPRALLLGEPPPGHFGYTYVSEAPWEAMILGILPPGELLQMPTDPVCRALLTGTPVYLFRQQPYRKAKTARLLQKELAAAEERLIQFGVRPLEEKTWS